VVRGASDSDRGRRPGVSDGLFVPVANAIVQHAERSVGRYAGALYLANTVGAVCGSVTTGFLLLPFLAFRAATALTMAAAVAVVPLYLATTRGPAEAGHSVRAAARGAATAAAGSRRSRKTLRHTSPAPHSVMALAGSLAMSGAALWIWLTLPAGHVITHATTPLKADERLLTSTKQSPRSSR
jgi:MFS family permease